MNTDKYDPNSVDQLTKQRAICLEEDCTVKKFIRVLEECQNRVKAKPYTAESCHQETVDLVETIDHCVGKKAFVDLV